MNQFTASYSCGYWLTHYSFKNVCTKATKFFVIILCRGARSSLVVKAQTVHLLNYHRHSLSFEIFTDIVYLFELTQTEFVFCSCHVSELHLSSKIPQELTFSRTGSLKKTRLSLTPVLSQIDSLHKLPSCLPKIHFNNILTYRHLLFLNRYFLSKFSYQKFGMHFSFPLCMLHSYSL
jgi:hypothetical protein